MTNKISPKAVQLPKYKTIFQYQNAIKFLNIPKLRKKHDCIVLAEQLLSSAQKKFGNESSMWSTIAIYNSSFSKNNIRLSDALRNVKLNIPNIHERWMVFAMMHDMEDKQSKGSGSNQLGVTFRIRFQKATKEHELSKAFLNQAYMSLSRENTDFEQIMNLLDNAIVHERESRLIFEDQMKQNPNSTTVLRGFGALLRDIYRDDETALLMFNQATAIEEENQNVSVDIVATSDKQSQLQKISYSQNPGSIASKRSDGKSINSTSNLNKMKKKKNSYKSQFTVDLSEDKQNLIPGFIQIILISHMLLVRKQLLQLMLALGLIMQQAYDIFIYCKYIVIRSDESDGIQDMAGVTFVPNVDTIKNQTLQTLEKLSQTVKEGFVNTEDMSIFTLWETEFINQTLGNYLPSGSDRKSQISSMWQEAGNFIDIIMSISNFVEDMISNTWDIQLDRANIPVTIIEVAKMIGIEYINSAQKKAIVSVVASVVLGFIALVVPLAVNIIQFVYTIRNSFIPIRFFVRALIGFILIMSSLVFTVIAVYASLAAVQRNSSIFLNGYRTALLGTCTLCAINLASTIVTLLPKNFECTLATNPMWTDEAQQLTGDSRIDSLTSQRTLKKDSETQQVQFDETECFESRDGDCDVPHRIYGLTKSYHGFEALFGLFTQDCAELISEEDPANEISLQTASVQQMGSLMLYDLKGGCSSYRVALLDEQTDQMKILETVLIVIFIISIISIMIGFVLLISTRTILFNVAESSSKMKELDPETDANERTGM
ncbi:MAG: hypothetical protein EZS28_025331, partial [Streblomastix strix]